MKRIYLMLFFAVMAFTECTHLPCGFHPNLSGSFQDWKGMDRPDTLWVREIFVMTVTGQKPKSRKPLNASIPELKEQIIESLEFAEEIEIMVSSDVKFIDIEAETFCPKNIRRDSCNYAKKLKKYVEINDGYEKDKCYLIPSYFLKSTWFKMQESGGGAGTLLYDGVQRHFRYLDFEVPVFRNGELIYSDSNYFIDTLVLHESEVQEKLFQIDQVIFDSLMYYSFDDKVEPLKLK